MSITIENVAQCLLLSRGIRVTPEYINETIFQVFGTDDEKEGELLDVVELIAMLVIPTILIMRYEIGHAENDASKGI